MFSVKTDEYYNISLSYSVNLKPGVQVNIATMLVMHLMSLETYLAKQHMLGACLKLQEMCCSKYSSIAMPNDIAFAGKIALHVLMCFEARH